MKSKEWEIVFDFRYRVELNNDQLKFFTIMPWFFAPFPAFMIIYFWLSEMPWIVAIIVSLIIVSFVGIFTAWRTVTINKEEKLITKRWKSFNIVFSEKEYQYHPKVFFHFINVDYDDGTGGYKVMLRMKYRSIDLLDSRDLTTIIRLRDLLEENEFSVKYAIRDEKPDRQKGIFS